MTEVGSGKLQKATARFDVREDLIKRADRPLEDQCNGQTKDLACNLDTLKLQAGKKIPQSRSGSVEAACVEISRPPAGNS